MRNTILFAGFLACAFPVNVFAWSLTAAEKVAKELFEQKAAHEQACAEAAAELLEAFAAARDDAERLKALSHENRLEIIAALRIEEGTFKSRGYLPFSAAMRPATLKYLRSFNVSAARLAKAYDKAIRLVSKECGLERAKALIDEKSSIARPISRWHCRLAYPRQHVTFTWTLYTDFTVNPDNDGANAYPKAWSLNMNSVVINNICPGCPKGGYRDTCKIRWDGQQFEARNQRGGLYVGHRIN